MGSNTYPRPKNWTLDFEDVVAPLFAIKWRVSLKHFLVSEENTLEILYGQQSQKLSSAHKSLLLCYIGNYLSSGMVTHIFL